MPQPKEYSVLLTADSAVNRSLRKNSEEKIVSPHIKKLVYIN